MAKKVDPAEMLAAVRAVSEWIDAPDRVPVPGRKALGDAVRFTVRTLAQDAPGKSVEVRVPPFAAVQCIEGPEHTRGTPPNVVECSPLTWLQLATGRRQFADAFSQGDVDASGARAGELARWLPIVGI